MSPIKANGQVFVRMLKRHKWYIILGGLYLLTIVADLGINNSFHIPCLFKTLFGISCPGCGITRAIGALFQGNVQEAWQYNPLLFFIIPILIASLVYQWRSIYHQIVHTNSVP
ncbi:DUF2752 domain-containing protein [Edaphocola flava]|uniref:DUF2752 domain-containing protein n=1 Tax=Edaphocola flava TaxID=2499629 RepID=UPI00100AD6E2|nr:DUF2752 domain-containing protein [Edaphocola flava]